MTAERSRALGYLCPACRNKVIEPRSAFALAASGARVACDCGKSALAVTTDGSRFRLTVPCGACGGEHTAEVDAARLLGEKGVGLACPQTKQHCCFIGEEYEVERALERLSLTAEQGDGELFTDSLVMHEVLAELREIAARPHGIACACGSEKYTMEVRATYVDLICADCGARLRIDAATDDDLDRLCCRWTLKIGGGDAL